MNNLNTYHKLEIKDGKLLRIKVEERTKDLGNIHFPEGLAVITHTGAYARIKFEYAGNVYISKGSPHAFTAPNRNEGVSSLAVAEDETIEHPVINVSGLNFGMSYEKMRGLHSKYFSNREGNEYWVPIFNEEQ